MEKENSKILKGEIIEDALDMATGTGDTAILLAKDTTSKRVEGIDLSKEMISIGNKKVRNQNLDHKCELKK